MRLPSIRARVTAAVWSKHKQPRQYLSHIRVTVEALGTSNAVELHAPLSYLDLRVDTIFREKSRGKTLSWKNQSGTASVQHFVTIM